MLSVLTSLPVVCPRGSLETSLQVQVSSCSELIGMPYRLGGGDGYIDCIQMVYAALDQMEIPTPTFNKEWYDKPRISWMRDFLAWGDRVEGARYSGDVLLFDGLGPMFGVVWENGAMHISEKTQRVSWCALSSLKKHWTLRYCPTKRS